MKYTTKNGAIVLTPGVAREIVRRISDGATQNHIARSGIGQRDAAELVRVATGISRFFDANDGFYAMNMAVKLPSSGMFDYCQSVIADFLDLHMDFCREIECERWEANMAKWGLI